MSYGWRSKAQQGDAFAQDPSRKTLWLLIELYGRDRERMAVEVVNPEHLELPWPQQVFRVHVPGVRQSSESPPDDRLHLEPQGVEGRRLADERQDIRGELRRTGELAGPCRKDDAGHVGMPPEQRLQHVEPRSPSPAFWTLWGG